MLAMVSPMAAELVSLQAALGRVLADAVVAMRDQPPFELSKGGENVRHCLARWRCRIDRAIEGNQRPSLILGGRHERGEVDHRAREPVELRDHQQVHTGAAGKGTNGLYGPPC